MKNLIGLFKDLQKNRKLIWELAKADFKKRFVGSYFGIVWMFVQPVVTVFIYFAIFQMGFKSSSSARSALCSLACARNCTLVLLC